MRIKPTFSVSLRRLVPVFALLLFVASGVSETVRDAPWFTRQIGEGVVWKQYQFESLYDHRQSVNVIIADLDTPGVLVRFPYLASSRQYPTSMIPNQYPSAVAGVNGTFFDTSAGGGGSTTYLKLNDVVITDNDNTGESLKGAVTKTSGETVRVQSRPRAGWGSVTNRADIVAQGPLLIYNGNRRSSTSNFCATRNPRTFVGITTDNHFILATVDGRTAQSDGMTCEEMQSLMLDLGCDDATNMDGGGSTCMWVRDEANNGVVNYPSDNGKYDHGGQRAVSNCIAIIANPAPPARNDARLENVYYSSSMQVETSQYVYLQYKNIGQTTWTQETVSLNVTRPRTRTSPFYDDSWVTTTTPAMLSSGSVAPGELGSFVFTIHAPSLSRSATFNETFGLVHRDLGIFGPTDSEPMLQILVYPPDVPATGQVIIESREGGQHFRWYEEGAGSWQDITADCTAPGLTSGIGQRYASTYRSVVGLKYATFTPNLAYAGVYDVDIAYGNAGIYARNPIGYQVTDADGTDLVSVDQTKNANTWVPLGRYNFLTGKSGFVEMTNEAIDVSGSMYAAAARFTPVPPTRVNDWCLY